MTYRIRAADARDLGSLARIEAAAALRFASVGMNEIAHPSPDDLLPADFARSCISDGTLWVQVDAQDRPVAFLAAEELDGLGFIAELDVDPAHAGQRLGAGLIARADEWAAGKGFPALTLTTFRDVPWNEIYYRKLGFVEWRRAQWGKGHERVWERQTQTLDITKRIMMIRPV